MLGGTKSTAVEILLNAATAIQIYIISDSHVHKYMAKSEKSKGKEKVAPLK